MTVIDLTTDSPPQVQLVKFTTYERSDRATNVRICRADRALCLVDKNGAFESQVRIEDIPMLIEALKRAELEYNE